MNIAIGADHRGYEWKQQLAELLRRWGHVVEDVGNHNSDNCDYPDFAATVGRRVAAGQDQRGVLICGSGIGICIAANKVPGIRAGVVHDPRTAELSRRHNDLNVICLSADKRGQIDVEELLRVWLETPFDGGRHAVRVEKIRQLEEQGR